MEPDRELFLMIGEIRAGVKQLLASSANHEKRISFLEKWRFLLIGLAAAGGSVIPSALAKAIGLH